MRNIFSLDVFSFFFGIAANDWYVFDRTLEHQRRWNISRKSRKWDTGAPKFQTQYVRLPFFLRFFRGIAPNAECKFSGRNWHRGGSRPEVASTRPARKSLLVRTRYIERRGPSPRCPISYPASAGFIGTVGRRNVHSILGQLLVKDYSCKRRFWQVHVWVV